MVTVLKDNLCTERYYLSSFSYCAFGCVGVNNPIVRVLDVTESFIFPSIQLKFIFSWNFEFLNGLTQRNQTQK